MFQSVFFWESIRNGVVCAGYGSQFAFSFSSMGSTPAPAKKEKATRRVVFSFCERATKSSISGGKTNKSSVTGLLLNASAVMNKGTHRKHPRTYNYDRRNNSPNQIYFWFFQFSGKATNKGHNRSYQPNRIKSWYKGKYSTNFEAKRTKSSRIKCCVYRHAYYHDQTTSTINNLLNRSRLE